MDTEAMENVSVEGRYANYFQIGYNAFEFLVDFGQFYGETTTPPLFHTRIVTGPSYAKALAITLRESLRRYEEIFGAIPEEVD
jgi:hypothetical protein